MSKRTMQFIVYGFWTLIGALCVSMNVYHLIEGTFGDWKPEYFLWPVNLWVFIYNRNKLAKLIDLDKCQN